MSLPSFPNIDPPIKREDAVNQILSSIAMEELGMSHILNAEGEKLQYILGTLPGLSGPAATVKDVLNANGSVKDLLETATQNQLLLKSKMQCALDTTPAQGPAGPTGSTGPTGPAGPSGPALPSAFAANMQGVKLQVSSGGTAVPLPDVQLLSPEITVNSDNTVFTVTNGGRYQITYHVNTTLALQLGTRLLVNGSAAPASTLEPPFSLSSFKNRLILNLSPNSTISLQLFTKRIGAATLISNGAGASLSIIRLGD